jgi:hypothetical protein
MDGNEHGLRKLSVVMRRYLRESAAAVDPSPASVAYQHTVLCQTCLPYRDPGDAVREWEREQGAVALKVSAGEVRDPVRGGWVKLGLPYGPKPRLILAHLNREALRTGSPEIEVEDSLTAFVRRIQGRNPTGPEIRLFKDQLARLSASIVRLGVAWDEERASTVNLPLVERFDLWFPKDEGRRVLWPASVRLSPTYFESLQHHAVPLDEASLAELAHSAMALDVYCWLAQRLHRVPAGRPQFVSWKALKDQFGQGYRHIRQFRAAFLRVLDEVHAQYRGAWLDADRKGLLLHHSPPPVLCRHSSIITGSKAPT